MEVTENTAAPQSDLSTQAEVPAAPKEPAKKSHGYLGMPTAAAAEAVGIAMAVGSALVAAVNTVRINFYRNMDKYKVFDDIKKERDDSYKRLYKEYKGKGADKSSELIKEMGKVEKEYSSEVDKLFKGYGFNSVTDRWRTLKYHQKNDVFLAFGAVSAILLGVVAGTSATRRVEENQEELEKKLDALQNKLDNHNSNTTISR